MLVCPTGGGKCLGLGTPVMLHDGTIVPVEQIKAGDRLMGPDSLPRKVKTVTKGYGPLYKIVPIKGDPWICNEDHLLTLVYIINHKIIDISVKDYLARAPNFRHCHKLFFPENGIAFASQTPLIINPYFLGVWFGDGSKRLDRIDVTKPDKEIEDLMRTTAQEWGLKVRVSYGTKTFCPTYHLSQGNSGGRKNPLLEALRSIVKDPKSIPDIIKTASRQERLQFLAGMIDTDGNLHHGFVEIAQRHKGIADGILFIARSLGFRAKCVHKFVNGTLYYRMYLSGDFSIVPTRLPRKTAQPRKQIKRVCRTGFSIEKIADGDYYGFELDKDGRFLLGDFTVTHNTVVAAEIIRSAVNKNKRAIFLAHRKELIDQAHNKLTQFGVSAGVVMGNDHRRDSWLPVQVCSVQTLIRREKPPADLLVIDEAHRTYAESYKRILDAYPHAIVLGLTATPFRTDKKGLADIFEDSVVAATPHELISNGALVPYAAFAYDAPQLHDIPIVAGDYEKSQLAVACSTSVIVGSVVQEYIKHTRGKLAIVFAVNVEHSQTLVKEFKAAGIRAVHLDFKTPRQEREHILADFAKGKIQIVSNCSILSEGTDIPPAEVCILARPTKSLTMFLQQIGRVLRPYPGKHKAIVHCHSGNLLRHGFVEDIVDYSLSTTPERTRELMSCPFCYAVQGYSVNGMCKSCGQLIAQPRETSSSVAPRKQKETVDGLRISADEIRLLRERGIRKDLTDQQLSIAKNATSMQKRAEYLRLVQVADKKSYQRGWARWQFRSTFGAWPNYSEDQLKGVAPAEKPFFPLKQQELDL